MIFWTEAGTTGRPRLPPLRDDWHQLVPKLAQRFFETARAGHATCAASRHAAEVHGVHVLIE